MSSLSAEQQTLRDLLNRGFKLLEPGDLRGAAGCCQQAIGIKPDLVPAHFLVGLVALEAQDRKTAFSAFGSVTKLDPAHAAAWAHLAKLYMGEGQVNLADAARREAGKVQSDDPMVNDLLGTVASLMGDYGEARALYQRAIDKAPNHPAFLLNLANNLVYHGQTGESKALFEKIIKLQPDSIHAAAATECGEVSATDRQRAMSWAQRLRRVLACAVMRRYFRVKGEDSRA